MVLQRVPHRRTLPKLRLIHGAGDNCERFCGPLSGFCWSGRLPLVHHVESIAGRVESGSCGRVQSAYRFETSFATLVWTSTHGELDRST